MSYIDIPIEVEPEALIADVYAEMADRFPGWTANEGSVEVWLVRAIVYRLVVPLAELSADVPAEIFQRFGETIHNVPAIAAAPATAESTWTMIDTAGYTIPADTEVMIAGADGTLYGFRVRDEVQVLAGASVTDPGEVILEAVEDGDDANGLTADPTLVDALAYIAEDGIALVGASSGGVDAEDPLDYLNRLRDTLQTLSPRPVVPRDVEILARSVAGVTRASAIDGYNPIDDTSNNEKMVTVAVVDANGAALSAPVKDEVEALLTDRRELNFIFHVIDPTYSTIKVNFQVVIFDGFDQATVEADVIAALTAYLSPANWGKPPYGPDTADASTWLPQTVVRRQDLSFVVGGVQGVDYWTTLKLAKGADALGTADVTLDGPAPLPQPGVIQVGS